MTCNSFKGRIAEIPGISIDNFDVENHSARVFFLSHMHTDHTGGLFHDSLLKSLTKTKALIYTTDLSAAVINHKKSYGSNLMDHVKVLKLGTSIVSIPDTEEYITVTVIPAGHCLGSVMYLLKYQGKTILYTGDFRITPNDVPKYGYLHHKNEPIKIDSLYIDTTFIDYDYKDFPKRSESVKEVLEEIKGFLAEGNREVALKTSAAFGYEYVFNEIYEKLGLKVYVDHKAWSFYGTITHLVPGVTNDKASTKIHLCRNRSDKQNHKNCMENYDCTEFLYIHFSALKWRSYDKNQDPFHKVSPNRIDVCFPTHCSRSELMFFLDYFRPLNIIGFPNEYKIKMNRKCLESPSKVTPKKRRFSYKQDTDKKVDESKLRDIFDL